MAAPTPDVFQAPTAPLEAPAAPATDEERREALLGRERRARVLGWTALLLGTSGSGICATAAGDEGTPLALALLFVAASLCAAGGGLALVLLRGLGRWLLVLATGLLFAGSAASGSLWALTQYFAPLVFGWLAVVVLACAPELRAVLSAEHRGLARRTPAATARFAPAAMGLALAVLLAAGNFAYQWVVVSMGPQDAESEPQSAAPADAEEPPVAPP